MADAPEKVWLGRMIGSDKWELPPGGATMSCGYIDSFGYTRDDLVPQWPTIDELAQIIRQVDGSHSMGAGELAESILEVLGRK